MTTTFAASWAQSGLLTEGVDYWFVSKGNSIEAGTDSILITREAFDEILNELEGAREKARTGDIALTACQALVEERASLQELMENSKQKWYVTALTGGGAFLGGWLVGLEQNDTITIRD